MTSTPNRGRIARDTLVIHVDANVVTAVKNPSGTMTVTVTDLFDKVQFHGTVSHMIDLYERFGRALLDAIAKV
jgi:hypothetical protein